MSKDEKTLRADYSGMVCRREKRSFALNQNRDFTLPTAATAPSAAAMQPSTVTDPHAACSSIILGELSMPANVQPRILSQIVFIVYNEWILS